MIKPKVTTKVKGQENVEAMMKEMELMKKSYVTIGITEEAGHYTDGVNPPLVVEVALWNEFGTKNIPERSFFRTAIDENESQINNWREELLEGIMTGKLTTEKALNTIGFRIQTLIQNKIKSNVPPPLADSTVAQKKHDGVAPQTLIDTGLMLRSVTYKVFMVGG